MPVIVSNRNTGPQGLRHLYRRPLLRPSSTVPATSCYRNTVIADGATAYWRLGESAGTLAVDEIAALNGTYTNTPTLGVASLLVGDANTAASFDNTADEYVTVTSGAAIAQGNGAFSYELWFQPTSAHFTGGTTRFLMMKGATGAASPDINMNGGTNLLEFRSDGWGNGATGTTGLVAGSSYHIVGTRSAVSDGNVWTIYVNGYDDTSTRAAPTTTDDGNPLLIGRKAGSATNNADGVIDEVAVYNGICLSAAQVQAHWQARSIGCGQNSYSLTAADSLGFADSVGRVGTFLRTTSDSLGVSDAITRILTLARTAADTLNLGNTVSRVVTGARTASDALGFSDALTRTGTFVRTAAGSLSITDSVAGARLIIRTTTDNLGISDAVTRVGTFIRTASDSLSLGNTVLRVFAGARAAADSLGFADAVTRVGTFIRTTADSLGFSDAVTAIKSGANARTVTDALNISDAVSRTGTCLRTAADSLSLGSTVSRVVTFTRTAADSVSMANNVTRVGTFFRSAADSLSITSVVSATGGIVGTIGGIVRGVGSAIHAIPSVVISHLRPGGGASRATPSGGASHQVPSGSADHEVPE